MKSRISATRHIVTCSLLSAIGGSGLTLALGQGPSPRAKDVDCSRLRVLDDTGQPAAILTANANGGMLTLLSRGHPFCSIYATGPDASTLHMFTKPGSPPTASLVVNPENGGHLTLFDAKGNVAWKARNE